jgi:hypothetical protein
MFGKTIVNLWWLEFPTAEVDHFPHRLNKHKEIAGKNDILGSKDDIQNQVLGSYSLHL